MIMQSQLLHHALTEAAAQRGASDAVVFAGKTLSWLELDFFSNRIAGAFRRRGIVTGERVVFFSSKHPLTIAGLYGAMRAGCVCVPLDTGSPASRLRQIVEDCSPSFICYSEDLQSVELKRVLQETSIPAQTIQDLLRETDAGFSMPSETPLKASGLAYLLYTSGSTGQPKGVMLSHQNVHAFAAWAAREFDLCSNDRVAGVSPLHFDLSTFDLFASALAGATLVLAAAHSLAFPVRLAEWLEQQRITVLYTVPSVLAGLVERGNLAGRKLDCLRLILFAGEPCPPRVLARLLELLPHTEFANLYGPTETNVCTFERIDRNTWDPLGPFSIGRACAGTEVVLIDQDDRLISWPGQIGELVAYGPIVSQGYWHDEERTRLRYQPPAGVPLRGRCFRTGDFAELNISGAFVFHGRRDHMVKIRGHRVELGEIEVALCTHPSVAEAAVIVAEERLIAFVCSSTPDLAPQLLLEHCFQRVLRHMVPAEVRILQEMPHGSTGKIDRGTLERMARG
ncbi:MAG TPA: amino acid adenylation domain-containing protein [Candidatus Angelobacter sp.]|nr:amino acid adenylation domain-containing protein [Candidatus Angelobacter sp.]